MLRRSVVSSKRDPTISTTMARLPVLCATRDRDLLPVMWVREEAKACHD